MLYFVGIGLKPAHLTEEGRKIARSCQERIVDGYTLPVPKGFYAELKKIIGNFYVAERRDLEDRAREIVDRARERDIVLLVWGDPFAATTHIMIRNMADEAGVPWKYVPGITALSVVPALLGLQHYRFGKTVTIPKLWKNAPSFFDRIIENRKRGAHTLCLVDIGMGMEEALEALIFWSERTGNDLGEIAGIARATWKDERIVVGSPEDLRKEEWGNPPFSLVVPARLHPQEEEAWERWKRWKKR